MVQYLKILGKYFLKALISPWGHHASCTAPMGVRGALYSVVDTNFNVLGVKNLRIVDASVFSRIPGLFIVVPIYMMAEKAAETILKTYGKKSQLITEGIKWS